MKMLMMMMSVQVSRCMGLGSISWDITIPAGVRLMVVLLVVVRKRGWLSGERAALTTFAVIEFASLIPASHFSECP
jgi:type III secretory pathway component EscS